MLRYGVAVVIGCLYVAFSVWLIRTQGESYRAALREARNDARPATGPGRAQHEETRTGQAVDLAAKPPPRPAEAVHEETRPVPAAPRADHPVEEKAAIASRPPGPAESKPIVPSPPPPSRPKKPTATAPEHDPFWDQPVLKESRNLANLKTEDELRLGRELHDVILHFNPRLENELLRRVEETAEPLLRMVSRKDIRYEFTILDSEVPNAFSHPGGFIYLSRGLMAMIGEDEDYALEFVIGHEIAHVDLDHALKCLRSSEVMKLEGGTLQKLYFLIIPFAYPDELEFEADDWVYRRMRQLDRTDRECLNFLNKLEGYSKRHDFENGRRRPNPSLDISPIDNHLRAHTAAYKRLKNLRKFKTDSSKTSK